MINRTIILVLLIFFTFCSQDKTPEQKPVLMEKKYFQSAGNTYLVEFVEFGSSFESKVSQLLDNKIYELTDKGIVVPIQDKNMGHGFFVNRDQAEFKYLIQISNTSSSLDKFLVNFQIFKNENGHRKRFNNPGTFNLTNMTANSESNDMVATLKDLTITLTYK